VGRLPVRPGLIVQRVLYRPELLLDGDVHALGIVLPGLPGTLAVNALGSFALGFVLYETMYSGVLASETRAVVSTGFLSSLTTYSTFAVQTAQSPPLFLVGNILANYALGFAGVVAGRALALRVDERWSA